MCGYILLSCGAHKVETSWEEGGEENDVLMFGPGIYETHNFFHTYEKQFILM
jgi:hypothetical protein